MFFKIIVIGIMVNHGCWGPGSLRRQVIISHNDDDDDDDDEDDYNNDGDGGDGDDEVYHFHYWEEIESFDMIMITSWGQSGKWCGFHDGNFQGIQFPSLQHNALNNAVHILLTKPMWCLQRWLNITMRIHFIHF